ncbi:MAG: hypothetical protein AAGA30_15675, partial [Planctomycetota bacterium]
NRSGKIMRLLVLSVIMITLANQCNGQLTGQPKPLASGVLKVIPPNIDVRDSYSLPLPLENLESQTFTPNYAPVLDTLNGQTKNVVFFRDVWQYEFGFLGLRQQRVQTHDQQGKAKTENVWYLVYRIRDTGKNMSYEKVQEDQRFDHIKNELKRDQDDFEVKSRFLPHFYLTGWVKPDDGDYERVVYRDQIDPIVLNQIRLAEDRNRQLLDKFEMMNSQIPRVKSANDDGIWGVAIWKDIDPRIDYVSVIVRGLTNAYRFDTSSSSSERKFKYRNLQLNFWRPGDRVNQTDDDITYGIPLVDDPIRQIEICQKYRLPGPLLRGYIQSQSANQNVLALEMDAEIQFSTFQSSVTPPLDKGALPESIRQGFANSGVEIPANVKVKPVIPGQKWTLPGKVNGVTQTLILMVEPQYWEPAGDGIRFINSLEHLWIYQ